MASKTFGKVVLQRSWKSLVIRSLTLEHTYHVAAELVSPSNPDTMNVIMLGPHSPAKVDHEFSIFSEGRQKSNQGARNKLTYKHASSYETCDIPYSELHHGF
jgi:hypothetical protein